MRSNQAVALDIAPRQVNPLAGMRVMLLSDVCRTPELAGAPAVRHAGSPWLSWREPNQIKPGLTVVAGRD